MKVRWNRAMLALLGDDPEFIEPSSLAFPEELSRLPADGFEEINGCIV
jgi:hypothetical protein